MELSEVQNYNFFLERSRATQRNSGIKTAIFLGFFMFCIYGAYAYAFFIGSVWVEGEYWNHAVQRAYTAGDTI